MSADTTQIKDSQSQEEETQPKSSEQNLPSNLEHLLRDIEALQLIVNGFADRERNTVEALRRAIDALHKEALTCLIRTLKTSPAALSALKEATADEIVYSVFRHHGLIKPSLNERIEQALDSVRPMLQGHGGNVELVEIILPDKAVVRLIGACSGCPASELTLSEGVEKAIKEYCPEIVTIEKAKGVCNQPSASKVQFISPFAKNDSWLFAAKLSDLPLDQIVTVEINGQSLLLSNTDGTVVCYQNSCSHLGMPLDCGEVKDGVLKCPYHAFEYLLKTGECLTVPEVQLHTHAVRVSEGTVEVCLS